MIPYGGYERLFYLIKLIRLFRGFQLFNVPVIMKKVEHFNKKRIEEIIKND